MSSITSPSASEPGVFLPPSTDTAVMLGSGDVQTAEIRFQVAGAVSAAQLDDCDGLTFARDSRREIIELRHLRRSECS